MNRLWLSSLMLPWIWGIGLVLLPRSKDRFARSLALFGALLASVLLTVDLVRDPAGASQKVMLDLEWVPELGLGFVIVRDGLAALFSIVVMWVAALVTLYAWHYLPHANHQEGSTRSHASFYALMSFFSAAMLGVVASGNILQLYFFWELTSIASYLLIGYWNHQPESRHGARLALILTVSGSISMLAGFFWLAMETGQWTFSGLLAQSHALHAQTWLQGCTALILIGALAKSAQFPFSSWLPAAMHAPTPVSAFLHSAALPAAGVFLLARFYPVLHTTAVWWWLLVVPASLGAIYSGFLAFRQEKMKPMLAYSTIGHFAFMFLAFGMATHSSVKAALYAFFVHAFIKAGLFLTAGSVTHVTGSKELARIGGLFKPFRAFAVFSIILGLALAGAPALGAFYYEEEYLKAASHAGRWTVYAVFWIGGVLSVLYMSRFLVEIFRGPQKPRQLQATLPAAMVWPIGIIAAGVCLTAFIPDWMGRLLVAPAIGSAMGTGAGHLDIKLEINTTFWVSMAKLALGLAVWMLFRRSRRLESAWHRLPKNFFIAGAHLNRIYERFSNGFLALHTGDVQFYLRVTFACFLGLTAMAWSVAEWPPHTLRQTPGQPIDSALTVVLAATVITAAATLYIRHYLSFVLLLTLTGFAMAAVFVLMGAPNIALAQVLVETLIDLSIILALKESLLIDPDRSIYHEEKRFQPMRLAASLGVGTVVAIGTYWAIQSYPADAVGQWYTGPGFSLSGKEDFVTAILTDFRALDTLVEILVFTTGMFAVIGLFWQEEITGE